MNKTQRVGITETGEIAFNLETFDHLYDANIVITKRLTDKLIEKLIEYKNKCILHLTCTGMGGSKLEPFVPSLEETKNKFDLLIESGFPVNQVVLRIDPIIPTPKGVQTALKVIKTFKDSGITRLRWSSLDMYEHVKERFKELGLPIPYESFHAKQHLINGLYSILESICYINDITLEACGEPNFKATPCLSQTDIDILGLTDNITLVGNAKQRGHCSCPQNKTQLISGGLNHGRCSHDCAYCYIKDKVSND